MCQEQVSLQNQKRLRRKKKKKSANNIPFIRCKKGFLEHFFDPVLGTSIYYVLLFNFLFIYFNFFFFKITQNSHFSKKKKKMSSNLQKNFFSISKKLNISKISNFSKKKKAFQTKILKIFPPKNFKKSLFSLFN